MSKNTNKSSNAEAKTVLIAGATGYAGRHLVQEYRKRHPTWTVKALVRQEPDIKFPDGVEVVMGEATKLETLNFDGVDIVVSALGITRQRDGLTYRDVDYQANMNLLEASIASGVKQFGYIHVINGEVLAGKEYGVVGIKAKQDFVNQLFKERSVIKPTVICPSGFFSDMQDFLDMAKSGRVWLFGDGHYKINPIHGADLATATVDAMDEQLLKIVVGGPDVFTQTELAQLALKCINPDEDVTKKVSYIWDGFRKFLLAVVPWVTPQSVYGPMQFFLTAMGMDAVGKCVGTHHLEDFWKEELNKQ